MFGGRRSGYKVWLYLITSLVFVSVITGCGDGANRGNDSETLILYSGRSEKLIGPIVEQFHKASGIEVRAKYGSTSEMAALILEEGSNSPADIFFAQDPAGLGAVNGVFATLPDTILNQVPSRYRSPDGTWVGLSGRARVVVYNTENLTETDLPDDIWGFLDPKWNGRIGWAPTNGSFQAMVTAMQVVWGNTETIKWLVGIQENNPKIYPKNTPIVAAVGAGEVDVGFVNHYYLHRAIDAQGLDFPARNHYLRNSGPGSVILVAGAGILETSENKRSAEKFIDFMLSQVAQQYFATTTFEYPLVKGIKTHMDLTPISELDSLEIDMAEMGDLTGTLKLLRELGIIP